MKVLQSVEIGWKCVMGASNSPNTHTHTYIYIYTYMLYGLHSDIESMYAHIAHAYVCSFNLCRSIYTPTCGRCT